MAKLVWLNIKTGQFSECWHEDKYPEGHPLHTARLAQAAEHTDYKLIRFECVNDSTFEFSHLMRIH